MNPDTQEPRPHPDRGLTSIGIAAIVLASAFDLAVHFAAESPDGQGPTPAAQTAPPSRALHFIP